MTRGGQAPWVVRRLPGTGRLFAGRSDRGATSAVGELGTVWRPSRNAPDTAGAPGLPLVVVFSPRPPALAWVASSVAAGLPAVVVVASHFADPLGALEAIAARAGSLGADTARIAIIGETDAAAAAIAACAGARDVTRLALLSPVLTDGLSIRGIPPALLQFAAAGSGATAVRSFERELRGNGVAVRSIDYTDLADGWARHPRAVRGARRGLDDLLGFLRRGFGVESTFRVIPGWDLH